MKQLYITAALVLGTLASSNAQTVFSSSIESWASGLPTDMYGSKSNIVADSVIQVTGSSDYGMNAVRLQNTTTTHKRFTNQPVSVDDTKTYEIKFWVKGQGDIRTGLFDGRATGSGYATYNAYIAVNTTTWTMYSQNITCANTTTAGEFIFSVRSTVAPNHLMIDSVHIAEVVVGPPADVSIYEIQYTTTPPYDSPYNGQTVNTGGIVTAYYFNGYFVQTGSGAWHGVEVFDTINNPVAGDSITFTCTVQEYFSNTRLNNITSYVLVSSGNPVPTPAEITTTTGNTEDFEGTLVHTISVCSDDNSGFGMWTVYTSPDSLRIDDMMYSYPSPLVGTTYDLTGCMSYNFGEFKLNPRKPSDVTMISSTNDLTSSNGLNVYPNPANQLVNIVSNEKVQSVNVFDLTGSLVLNQTGTTLNTSHLVNGVYLVKVTTANGTLTEKLVVKH